MRQDAPPGAGSSGGGADRATGYGQEAVEAARVERLEWGHTEQLFLGRYDLVGWVSQH